MEFGNKLDHLNLPELACTIGMDFGSLVGIILQRNELKAADIPVIVKYGDLCKVISILGHSNEKLINCSTNKIKNDSLADAVNIIHEVVEEQSNLLNYVADVLCDGNYPKKMMERLINTENR